jgi:hypothetical protein
MIAAGREARQDDLTFIDLPLVQLAGRYIDDEAVALEVADAGDARHGREVLEEDDACVLDREFKREVFVGQEALGFAGGPVTFRRPWWPACRNASRQNQALRRD